jgi:S-DNA-T family DNA segregation ATPase FtsK/SpoIIIE
MCLARLVLLGGAPGAPSPLAGLIEFLPHATDVGMHVVLVRRVAGASRAMMADPVLVRLRETGCAGLVLAGDPREGVLIADVKASPGPPGRGRLVRRGRPPVLIQIAIDASADAAVDETTVSAAGRH